MRLRYLETEGANIALFPPLVKPISIDGKPAESRVDGIFPLCQLAPPKAMGAPFDCGFSPEETDVRNGELLLKIMPLRTDAPTYLLANDWPKSAAQEGTAELMRVKLITEAECHLSIR